LARGYLFRRQRREADIHRARMALSLQNLMSLGSLLDKVEDGAANAFGIIPRKRAVTIL
jgi:hypothetical protein